MTRASEVADRYRGGRLVHRWSLVAGWPRCVLAPLDVETTPPAEVAATEASNAAIRAAAAATEVYEAALALTEGREAPPAGLPDGEGGTTPNPAWPAWAAAVAAINAASPETVARAAVRREGARGDARVLAALDGAGVIVALTVTDDPEMEGVPVPPEARIGGRVVAGAYQPPPAWSPVPEQVSIWQFMCAAAHLGLITAAEAEAATRNRVLPGAFADAFDALPPEQAAMARIKFAGITMMVRSDPLFGLLVATGKATEGQLDGVFRAAAAIA